MGEQRFEISPHLLFNSLSGIQSLISKDRDGAREMVADLAELCHLAIKLRPVEFVTLRQELEMTALYLKLEQKRYGSYLKASFQTDPQVEENLITCFTIYPLVENAIKYGKLTSPDSLSLTVTTRQEQDRIFIRVTNTGTWVGPDASRGVPSTGLSLTNLRERLREHYQESCRLDTSEDDGQVHVEVIIPATSHHENIPLDLAGA